MGEKLKTLKDIEKFKRADGTPCEGHIPDTQELRQEAIKWIKNCGCYKGKNKSFAFNNCDACLRFMNFFNITNEKLK